MTYVCEKCGYRDNPIWKPLFWKLYGMQFGGDFTREHGYESAYLLADVIAWSDSTYSMIV
jgi:hypothetical protein